MKKVIIVGAGPGGLAAGMLLRKRGYDVSIYEKNDLVGGRSRSYNIGSYTFDMGPTSMTYPSILKEVFERSGFKLEDTVSLIELDHLYQLIYDDVRFDVTKDFQANATMFDQYQKGLGDSYQHWHKAQEKKFHVMKRILKMPFLSRLEMLKPEMIRARPSISNNQSLDQYLKRFSKNKTFVDVLAFQQTHFGMSPVETASFYAFLPYLEHRFGLYQVRGGLHMLHEKMASLFESMGGKLYLSTPVKRVMVENGVAKGIKLQDDTVIASDITIVNADYAYAMHHLFYSQDLKKHHPFRVQMKKYSPSALMIYLGLDQTYPFDAHQIVMSKDQDQYYRQLAANDHFDNLMYAMRYPSAMDPTLAPKGHSTLSIMVPVPNLDRETDWDTYGESIKDAIIRDIEIRFNVEIRTHIKAERLYTPYDWQDQEHIYLGAIYALSHKTDQIMDKRPKLRFEDIKNVYLVGDATHPGSGLPFVYQSALMLDDLLST